MYSSSTDSAGVAACQETLNREGEAKKVSKEERLHREQASRTDNIGGYMEDMDLPPITDDDYGDDCEGDEAIDGAGPGEYEDGGDSAALSVFR